MFDECSGCGEVRLDRSVRTEASVVVCPNCGRREPIHREPLLVVSGAGGTGKSAVLRNLRGTRDDVVMLDSDVLWRHEFWEELEWYTQTWLRLCRDIAQSKRPPVLFGAGFGVPANVEQHPQHECFSDIQYLILVCDEREQRRRLRDRPAGRHPDPFEMDEDSIAEQIEFNQWLKDESSRDDFTVVETTDATIETTAERVDRWISDCVTDTGQ